jgi:spore coat polysaccharide biosynthesis protein SpsF
MNILAIIQARMSSTRLPGKVLFKLEDKTVLEHVINRVKRSKKINEVIVATSINQKDLAIVKLCAEKDIRVFCGSEDDVLDRFYQAARLIKPKNIVRITADCPLIDWDIIDKVIDVYQKTKVDYISNANPPTFPDGLDVVVFSFAVLKDAWQKARLLSEREHIIPYIRKNKHKFKCGNVSNKVDLSGKRWTLDEKEDYIFLKKIFKNLYPRNHYFTTKDVLEFLKENPKLEKINVHIKRNEGYLKSLKKDKLVNIGRKEKDGAVSRFVQRS